MQAGLTKLAQTTPTCTTLSSVPCRSFLLASLYTLSSQHTIQPYQAPLVYLYTPTCVNEAQCRSKLVLPSRAELALTTPTLKGTCCPAGGPMQAPTHCKHSVGLWHPGVQAQPAPSGHPLHASYGQAVRLQPPELGQPHLGLCKVCLPSSAFRGQSHHIQLAQENCKQDKL